jgi:hypothetical protein
MRAMDPERSARACRRSGGTARSVAAAPVATLRHRHASVAQAWGWIRPSEHVPSRLTPTRRNVLRTTQRSRCARARAAALG